MGLAQQCDGFGGGAQAQAAQASEAKRGGVGCEALGQRRERRRGSFVVAGAILGFGLGDKLFR
jgi:hypothetical protein